MIGSFVAALATLITADGARRHSKRRSRSLSTCGVKGSAGPTTHIVNGDEADECEWRWQVQLRRDGKPFCGGSLITPEWVLSAAHCAFVADFEVVVGDYNKSLPSSNQQQRSASVVVRHPEYRSVPGMNNNDFMMIKLDSPVTINDCVGTVCLPAKGQDVAPDTACWISGWGHMEEGGISPDILQEVTLTTMSNDRCVNDFGYNSSDIDDSMLCAQGVTSDGRIADGCQGDSGGPLVCENAGQWTLYGATSWGLGCAQPEFPGVWARVHKELDWIEEVLDGVFPTPAPTPPPPTPEPTPRPAPTPPGMCPAHFSTGPDSKGDCKCHYGLYCYEGGKRGCTNAYTASHDFKSSRYFLPACTACQCQ